MATIKQLQKQFNKIWTGSDYDPWKQQVVINTTDGELLIQLDRDDRQFTLMSGMPTMTFEDIKGIEAITEKVKQLINDGKVTEIYLDYQ